jgi:hypothetical protein
VQQGLCSTNPQDYPTKASHVRSHTASPGPTDYSLAQAGKWTTKHYAHASKGTENPVVAPLNGYVHFIGCKSRGLHFYPHNCMEDTLYACYKDALRTRIIRGQAFACLNEDKRPRAIGNLVTSTPVHMGSTTMSTPNSMKETKQIALQFMGVTSPVTYSRSTRAPRGPTPTKTRTAWRNERTYSTPFSTFAANRTSTPSTGMSISVRENTPSYRPTNEPKV